MTDPISLINIGELSKTANLLIEKISDAVGGFYLPYQIKRVARAEADADKTKVIAQIEIAELKYRAINRLIIEEEKKQRNMESITAQALTQLDERADPKGVEDDWITNFFDRCRLVSDQQMQSLWARVLAGEANSPGKFSKRTVNLLSSLDKRDASLFTRLCGFAWYIGEIIPLVYDTEAHIYNQYGINYDTMRHLDNIGLISFNSIVGYRRIPLPMLFTVFYHDMPINIVFSKESGNDMHIGKVLLSQAGQELAGICGSQPVPDFLDYVIGEWSEHGYVTSSPYPKERRPDQAIHTDGNSVVQLDD